VIGICDWGIGGLGFYKTLRAERPDLNTVYIGDQGAVPYGRLSAAELAARLSQVRQAFVSFGVTRMVVACNAASTVLEKMCPLPTIQMTGVIAPTLAYLREQPYACVGVIGGERTIESGAYSLPLQKWGKNVRAQVTQPLSGLIECGAAYAPETLALLTDLLLPLRGVDALVLACTHYIVLGDAIAERLPGVPLIDPAALTWEQAKQELPPPAKDRGVALFYSTGEPFAMQTQMQTVFGICADVRSLILPETDLYDDTR
jgi:glutamate racemase